MKKLTILFAFILILSSLVYAMDHNMSFEGLNLPPGLQVLENYYDNIAFSITFLVAFLAGLITFTSPCGFVILPAFLTTLKEKNKAVKMSLAFCLGLSLVFIVLGLLIAFIGNWFLWKETWKATFAIIAGIFLIIFAVFTFLGVGFGVKKECKIISRKHKNTFFGNFSFGALIGLGWTPCVGTVLSGIFLYIIKSGNILNSLFLLLAYTLGISLPLLIIAFFSDKYNWQEKLQGKNYTFGKVKTNTFNIVSSLIILIIALLMLKDKGTYFFMNKIPQYLPWSMELFTKLNDLFVKVPLLQSGALNIILAIIVLTALFVIIKKGFSR